MTADQRTTWATTLIRRGREIGQLPRFGDDMWLALPDGDPRKVAAVVVAAEARAQEGDDLRGTLELQLAGDAAAIAAVEEMRWSMRLMLEATIAHTDIDDAEFGIVARQLRALAQSPTHAELQRRRRSVAA